jgi:hypothetical protein
VRHLILGAYGGNPEGAGPGADDRTSAIDLSATPQQRHEVLFDLGEVSSKTRQ